MASLADILSDQQEDQLVLVDLLDREVGTMGKLAAHEQARLHRAFSVFLYRGGHDGRPVETLVQRRAAGKYHSGGLLTNSCCSHPRAGEPLDVAAQRRVEQELGVTGVRMGEVGSFVYRARLGEGLVEFEYDHVLIGRYDGPVTPDPQEASEVAWVEVGALLADLEAHPSRYTAWFMTAAPMAVRGMLGPGA